MGNFTLFLSTIFGGAWSLFQIKVPGFPFSFGDVLIGASLASAALAVVKFAFGTEGAFPGAKSVGKSTRNPKISKERMNDTK